MGDVSNMAPASNQTVEIGGTIMVAAIVVLFMVIAFILFVHLYAKWFWSRQVQDRTRRSSRRRGLQFNPAQDPAFAMHRGLEPSVISSIPVVVFNAEKFEEGLECAVCLSELEDGEKARLLPKCNHGFHVECIDMWFQSHSTCPLCRNTVGGIESEKSSPTQDGSEVLEEDMSFVYSGESLNFPTNVLFWGDQTQITTGAAGLEEAPSSNSSRNGALTIEIPRQTTEEFSSVPLSSLTPEEEMKSPTMAPLRSLRRLLSRENRGITPSSPSSVDVELGEVGRGQSSKTTTD